MPELSSPPLDQNNLQDILREMQERQRREVAPPVQTPGGPPVLPSAQGIPSALPLTTKPLGTQGVLGAVKGKSAQEIVDPALQAVAGLQHTAQQENMLQEMLARKKQDDFTQHYLKQLPKFGTVAQIVHPEEEVLHRARQAWEQRPSFAATSLPLGVAGPGYQPAPGGPVGQLQQNEAQALVGVSKILPTLSKDLDGQYAVLKMREKSLHDAMLQWKAGKLSPSAEAELHRDAALQKAAVNAFNARVKQVNDYSTRYNALYNTYRDTPLHSNVNELGGNVEHSIGKEFIKNIARTVPIPGVSGAIAAEPEIDKARNVLMLKGDYPPPPANPGRTPQERQVYDKQTRDLVSFLKSRPFGKQLASPGLALSPHQIHLLTPYQQQIYPAIHKMFQLEDKLNMDIGFRRFAINYGANIVGFKAGGIVGGLAGKLTGKYAPLAADPLAQMIGRPGARAAVQHFITHGVPHLVGGAAGGGTFGSITAGVETAAIGGNSQEIAHSMRQNFGSGTVWGTGGAFLHYLGGLAHSALLSNYDPVHTPTFVENEVTRWQRDGLVTSEEAPVIKQRLIDFAKTPRVMKTRAAQALYNDFPDVAARAQARQTTQTSTPPPRARPQPAGARRTITLPTQIPQETHPGPTITTATGETIRLREHSPQAFQRIAEQHPETATAIAAWAAHGAKHEAHRTLPVPAAGQQDHIKLWENPQNATRSQHDHLTEAANRLKGTDADLAQKLTQAAGDLKKDFDTRFRYSHEKRIGEDEHTGTTQAAAPPQVSVWRQLSPPQRHVLPQPVQQILLTQDISNSAQVLQPELPGTVALPSEMRGKSIEEIERYADQAFNHAQEHFATTGPHISQAPSAPPPEAIQQIGKRGAAATKTEIPAGTMPTIPAGIARIGKRGAKQVAPTTPLDAEAAVTPEQAAQATETVVTPQGAYLAREEAPTRAQAETAAELERVGMHPAEAVKAAEAAKPPSIEEEIAQLQAERAKHKLGSSEFGTLTSQIGKLQDRLAVQQHHEAIRTEAPKAAEAIEGAIAATLREAGTSLEHVDPKDLNEVLQHGTLSFETPEGTTHHITGVEPRAETTTRREIPAPTVAGGPHRKTAAGGAVSGLPAEPPQPGAELAPGAQSGGKAGGGAELAGGRARRGKGAAQEEVRGVEGGKQAGGGVGVPGRGAGRGPAAKPTPEPKEIPSVVLARSEGAGLPAAAGAEPHPPSAAPAAAYQSGQMLKSKLLGATLRLEKQTDKPGQWRATVVDRGKTGWIKGENIPVTEDSLAKFETMLEKGKKGGEKRALSEIKQHNEKVLQRFVNDLPAAALKGPIPLDAIINNAARIQTNKTMFGLGTPGPTDIYTESRLRRELRERPEIAKAIDKNPDAGLKQLDSIVKHLTKEVVYTVMEKGKKQLPQEQQQAGSKHLFLNQLQIRYEAKEVSREADIRSRVFYRTPLEKENLQIIREAETSKPVKLIGFRYEIKGNAVPETGTFYSIEHPIARDYGMVRGATNIEQRLKGTGFSNLNVNNLEFKNPLVIKGGHADLAMNLSEPETDAFKLLSEQGKKAILAAGANLRNLGERGYILYDKAIAQAVKEAGFDGIVYRRQAPIERINDTELVDLRGVKLTGFGRQLAASRYSLAELQKIVKSPGVLKAIERYEKTGKFGGVIGEEQQQKQQQTLEQHQSFEDDLIKKYGSDENVPDHEWDRLEKIVRQAAAERVIVESGKKGGIKLGDIDPSDPRFQQAEQIENETYRAYKGEAKKTFIEKARDFKNYFLYPYPELAGKPQFEEFSQRLTQARKRGIAAEQSLVAQFRYLEGLTEEQHRLLSQLQRFRDMQQDVLKSRTLEAPFEPDMVPPALLQAEIAAMQDPAVWKAFRMRQVVQKPITDERMRLMKKLAGVNLNLNQEDYMHHMVLEYADGARLRGKPGSKIVKRPFEFQRKGTTLPMEKALILSDGRWMPQMLYDNQVLSLYEYAKDNLDIYDQVELNAKALGIPVSRMLRDPKYAGYGVLQLAPGNPFFRAWTLPQRLAHAIQTNGEELVKAENIHEITAVGKRQNPMLLPNEVIATLQRFNNPNNELDAAFSSISAGLRRFIILNPLHVGHFAVKKISTDIETLARNPRSLPFLTKAGGDFANFIASKHKTLTPELARYQDMGGFQGFLAEGYGIQTTKGLNLLKQLAQKTEQKPYLAAKIWNSYFDAAGMGVTALDSTARYAAWLYARDYMMKNEGRPPGWGSSPPANLMAIGTRPQLMPVRPGVAGGRKYLALSPAPLSQEAIDIRAWKWAQDLQGNYDDRSLGNRWLSQRLHVLFPAWPEVNARRYWWGFRNAGFNADTSRLGEAAQQAFGKGGLYGVRLLHWGLYAAGALATTALMHTFNRFASSAQEEKAPSYFRDTPHITLPFFDSLTERPIVINTPGGLGELLDHIPFVDVNGLLGDSVKTFPQRVTMQDVHKRMSMPWDEKLSRMGGLRTLLPDLQNVRDTRTFAKQVMSRVGLRPLYEMAAEITPFRIPKQKDRYTHLLRGIVGVYETDPAQTAFYEIQKDVALFLNDRGIQANPVTSRGTLRSNALYWYIQSLQAGDREAAKSYLADYITQQGNKDTLAESLHMHDPLFKLRPEEKETFLKGLKEEDRRRLTLAYNYYQSFAAPQTPLSKQGASYSNWIDDAQRAIAEAIDTSDVMETLQHLQPELEQKATQYATTHERR